MPYWCLSADAGYRVERQQTDKCPPGQVDRWPLRHVWRTLVWRAHLFRDNSRWHIYLGNGSVLLSKLQVPLRRGAKDSHVCWQTTMVTFFVFLLNLPENAVCCLSVSANAVKFGSVWSIDVLAVVASLRYHAEVTGSWGTVKWNRIARLLLLAWRKRLLWSLLFRCLQKLNSDAKKHFQNNINATAANGVTPVMFIF